MINVKDYGAHGGKRTRYQAAYRNPALGTLAGITISNLRADGCALPCHGVYLRHIDGLRLHNLQVENRNPGDPRPALAFEQVKHQEAYR